jgi:hypothetical protein
MSSAAFVFSTTQQVDTPLKNSIDEDVAEIKVIDPRHPLFGYRFPLVSSSLHLQSAAFVYVTYQEGVTLRIERAATNLAPLPLPPAAKLTSQALRELVSLAKECEVLCPPSPQTSGNDCHPTRNSSLSQPSRRSSGR